jgi:hypothetical protein
MSTSALWLWGECGNGGCELGSKYVAAPAFSGSATYWGARVETPMDAGRRSCTRDIEADRPGATWDVSRDEAWG